MDRRFHAEEKAMKCVICRHGETRPGTATVTLERDGATVVVKGVPARVCEECGEEYVDEDAGARVLSMAEDAAKAGIRVEVREYDARPAGAHG
jgi:YgiT-type zinc finger domain-containing protein